MSDVVTPAHQHLSRLENRVAELEACLEEFMEAARYDVHMSGPRFSGWNRSALDRALASARKVMRT